MAKGFSFNFMISFFFLFILRVFNFPTTTKKTNHYRHTQCMHGVLAVLFRISVVGAVLDEMATISAVLYANTNHPELKVELPNWSDRSKQILKKWRALPTEKKAPYLQKARDNRSALRMKKVQHVSTALRLTLLSLNLFCYICS